MLSVPPSASHLCATNPDEQGEKSILKRNECKVSVEGVRVFSVPTDVDDADR